MKIIARRINFIWQGSRCQFDGDYILAKFMAEAIDQTGVELPQQVNIYMSANAHQHVLIGEGLNLFWMYSHPGAYKVDYLNLYDTVLCASPYYAKILVNKGVKVLVLEEAGIGWDESHCRDLEFIHVGNYKHYRTLCLSALKTNKPMMIYGQGWTDKIPDHFDGGPVQYTDCIQLYNTAICVLDDRNHDMRKLGFLGQRAFTATLCGCTVVSDIENYEGKLRGILHKPCAITDESYRKILFGDIDVETLTFEARVRELIDIIGILLDSMHNRNKR